MPLILKASPSLLQDNFKLYFRCESHLLSQCNSSVCDLGTRGFLGETLRLVASVFIKQRHQSEVQNSLLYCQSESKSHSVVSDSLWPQGLYSPWKSPGQNTGVGSLSLLQGIFPTQGSNPGLPYCRWILYQLSHKGPNKTGVGSLSLLQGSSQPRNWTRVSCLQADSLPTELSGKT